MNQRKSLVRSPSYFEHNEQKNNSKIVAFDVIEWPESIQVQESDSDAARWNFRIKWHNRIKGLLK